MAALRSVSASLEQLAQQCLSYSPSARPSAADLLRRWPAVQANIISRQTVKAAGGSPEEVAAKLDALQALAAKVDNVQALLEVVAMR
jgi:hypothetical protein